ncbi:putative sterigmatocystin biosynthesis monooxygenase stcW [Cyphellophora attinorum]|uniref:Putative sterigmatocystin biosynthesis monooxygenase stcW n=1 Tax=Cyphellophora attinorum TaxID=1664694 RepID=A0A0N1NXM2_9EURO|nr:putative sterigmatocystin biosynthesis monooxygenase stcW [Phialophora attinorum]KPI34552.1 putative sterigmatocystin biosynthesis monooxygenase stcW [Phialophora attinorum]
MSEMQSDANAEGPKVVTRPSNDSDNRPDSAQTGNGSTATASADYVVPDVVMGVRRRVKVVFIGFGLTGIDFAYKAKSCPDIDFQIYEKNPAAGGTWYENTYPGCACDVPISIYQYSWNLKSNWKKYYATQPEICGYLQETAREHELDQYVKYQHEVLSCDWLEDKGRWRFTIMPNKDPSKIFSDEADFLIKGSGILNNWTWPDIAGFQEYKGEKTHTGNYDRSIDLKGKRIGVIGLGSSAIQTVAAIVPEVGSMVLFHRTPHPKGQDLNYTEELKKRFASDPEDYLEYVKSVERELSGLFKVYIKGSPEMVLVNEMARKSMLDRLGQRQDIIDAMVPTDFPVGCRRPTPGTGFLEALQQPNVKLASGWIKCADATGLIRDTGEHVELDVIICATGFVTTFRPRFPLNVRGENLSPKIGVADRPTYMGLATPGVPNYFVSMGPYAPYVQGSASKTVEYANNYFLQVIQKFQTDFIKEIVPKWQAAQDFKNHADKYLERGVWGEACRSWFKGGDAKGTPAIWPGSRAHSLRSIEVPRFEDYDITYVHGNRFAYMGNGFDLAEIDGSDSTWYYARADNSNRLPIWEFSEAVEEVDKTGVTNGTTKEAANGIEAAVPNGIVIES